MDATAFKAARLALGLTEIEFAAHFGVSRRTIQNWSTGKGPPTYIADLIELALSMQIAPPKQPERMSDGEAMIELSRNLAPALERIATAARNAGWTTAQIARAIQHLTEQA